MNEGKNSQTAWMLLRKLADLDTVYGQGRYDDACESIREIGQLARAF